LAIQGGKPYHGYHNWELAALYYAKAGQLCAGWILLLIGLAGLVCTVRKRTYRPAFFLLLTPAFYVLSMHSSGNPISVPQFPPHGYYNSRYGIALVAFSAFTAGALVAPLSGRWVRFAFAVPALAVLPWLPRPSQQNWICWKESQVNSVSRRAWTSAGAEFLRRHYISGQGILTPSASGDLAGIFSKAQIPLKETLNIGNGPYWMANTARPDLIHQQLWAVDQAGDALSGALSRPISPYKLARGIRVAGAPELEIRRRTYK
jgi:hypothetical protein